MAGPHIRVMSLEPRVMMPSLAGIASFPLLAKRDRETCLYTRGF